MKIKKSIHNMLTDAEQALLRETEKAHLAGLDEDELVELHTRVRRARSKYSKLYRRRASAQVSTDATRAGAHAKHARTAVKAEVFEAALSRVSRELARAARASAEELRAEMHAPTITGWGLTEEATARPEVGRGAGAGKGATKGAKKKARTPASERSRASTRAAGKRAQAKRDRR